MYVLGQREHLEMCYSFIQFESFGAMSFNQALDQLEQGYLTVEEVQIFPMSKSLTVIRLTGKGKRQSKLFRNIWDKVYLPSFDDPDYTLIDEYQKAAAGSGQEFAISHERFEQERKAGNINTIISKCPAISERGG